MHAPRSAAPLRHPRAKCKRQFPARIRPPCAFHRTHPPCPSFSAADPDSKAAARRDRRAHLLPSSPAILLFVRRRSPSSFIHRLPVLRRPPRLPPPFVIRRLDRRIQQEGKTAPSAGVGPPAGWICHSSAANDDSVIGHRSSVISDRLSVIQKRAWWMEEQESVIRLPRRGRLTTDN